MIPPFARNIKALRDKRGMTQEEFAESVNVSRQTIVKWERGDVAKPRQTEILNRIIDEFGVSEDDLLSESAGLYAKLHGLVDAPAGAMAALAPRMAHAPMLGKVHAGTAEEPAVVDDSVPVPYEVWEHHKHGYFLEVVGTCMDRVYPEGCLIYIDPDREPQSGSIAVVSIGAGDFIMRRLWRGANTLVLSPESHDSQWEDIVVQADGADVRTWGTVVWFQSREEME